MVAEPLALGEIPNPLAAKRNMTNGLQDLFYSTLGLDLP